jgi:threonine synthase|tara:strand:+ start:1407 stop:2798 length:1392 start_codon:yes stop_codon:yes gene_type:complete
MLYKSTRGQSPAVPFSEVLLGGLAPDGGLYVPEEFPNFTQKEIEAMASLSFSEVAAKILFPFVSGEIDRETFSNLVKDTYRVFEDEDVVKLVESGDERWILELFHGPTLAFKDVAMQLLGALLDYFSKKQGRKIAVLGATSGDTGAAAIAACSRFSNVDIFILYPHGRVTEVQRKQMTTSEATNVHALAIESDFDGCQALVKEMFLDESLMQEDTRFIAANSINWTRCMTQSVYFFWSYLRLKDEHKELSFSIPSGNFGHAYAGWAAKEMGLPIKRLLIATNSNDVLHTLFSNNHYEKTKVDQTLAPSMDISVASNFERLLYNLYDNDAKKLSEAMNSFPKKPIAIPKEKWNIVTNFFDSLASTDDQIVDQIKHTFKDSGYLLDPHTATGIRATEALSAKGEPVVTMSTAHPSKFVDAIEQAIPGFVIEQPEQLKASSNREEVFTLLTDDLDTIKNYITSNTQ